MSPWHLFDPVPYFNRVKTDRQIDLPRYVELWPRPCKLGLTWIWLLPVADVEGWIPKSTYDNLKSISQCQILVYFTILISQHNNLQVQRATYNNRNQLAVQLLLYYVPFLPVVINPMFCSVHVFLRLTLKVSGFFYDPLFSWVRSWKRFTSNTKGNGENEVWPPRTYVCYELC